MLTTLLPYTRYVFTLALGVIFITAFTGVNYRHPSKAIPGNRSPWPAVPLLIIFLLAIHIFLLTQLGFDNALKLYPIHTHLIVILFLVYYYHTPWYTAIMSLLLCYMLCQIPAYFYHMILEINPEAIAFASILYIVIILLAFRIVVYSDILEYIQIMVKRQTTTFYIYLIIPIGYYIFDYVATVYSDFLYSGYYRITQLVPTLTCVFYFAFVVLLCKENIQYQKATKENAQLESQFQKVEIEYEGLRNMQDSARIYRHDMRHHFSLLLYMAEQNKVQDIIGYLNENIDNIGDITPKNFCRLEMLNLILSRFATEAESNNVEYDFDISLPESYPFSKTELCSMVSNALENALNALNDLEGIPRQMNLKIKEFNGNFVFSLENTCGNQVEFENGIPQNHAEGHGFGTKSIAMIAKKHHGEASFTLKDNKFRVIVMIPLNDENPA